jgi:hypothetical protein
MYFLITSTTIILCKKPKVLAPSLPPTLPLLVAARLHHVLALVASCVHFHPVPDLLTMYDIRLNGSMFIVLSNQLLYLHPKSHKEIAYDDCSL